VLDLETIITSPENPVLSEAKGWGDSVVLRVALENSQPKAPGAGANTRDLIAHAMALPSNESGGVKAPAEHKMTLPRVLVIDDEDFIRELYKDVFESKGITVFAAQSGDEALRVFQTLTHKPDIIIMDHRMPGKDGIETTKEILRMDPTIPIIFSSADETVREQALAAGAVSFWAKPFPVTMLVNAMIDIVEARRKRSSQHFH
jgi:two-component system chemotaxis response regulator CheY